MFGLKLSVRGHQHVFQLEIPELQAFHGKIELGPEIIIMAPYSPLSWSNSCFEFIADENKSYVVCPITTITA